MACQYRLREFNPKGPMSVNFYLFVCFLQKEKYLIKKKGTTESTGIKSIYSAKTKKTELLTMVLIKTRQEHMKRSPSLI